MLLAVGLLWGCTTSSSEKQEEVPSNSASSFVSRTANSPISEEIANSLTSKRRGKLNRLMADGPAWFNFRVNNGFDDLQLIFINEGAQSTYTWKSEMDETEESNVFAFSETNTGSEELSIDVLIKDQRIVVFFNSGEETFTFQNEASSLNFKIEVYIDDTYQDIPGVLYDIGI